MSVAEQKPFVPLRPDAAGVISWVHLGDLHMTKAGEQNDLDLRAIVKDINEVFAQSISFVFLPGDVADDGSRAAYAVVRRSLDELKVPWCAILGDHDVHEKSFDNFLEAMAERTFYSFSTGGVHFVAMNAFDVPHPESFTVSAEQNEWAGGELQRAVERGEQCVLLLHCYPSDLKAGAEPIRDMIRRFDVLLVEMGHTHYNELANDGRTIYAATRSTGQIEEGRVGFSVTNIDGKNLSWRFFELGELPGVMITSPADDRLRTKKQDEPSRSGARIQVRAKVWSRAPLETVEVFFNGRNDSMRRVKSSNVWETEIEVKELSDGIYPMEVVVKDEEGGTASDRIQVGIGPRFATERPGRDQDQVLKAWPEHGLLGTQLGPNKNGRKW